MKSTTSLPTQSKLPAALRTLRLVSVILLFGLLAACQISEDVNPSADDIVFEVAGNTGSDLHPSDVHATGVIEFVVREKSWMSEVSFFVNDELQATLDEPPYRFEFDTDTLEAGLHTAHAVVLLPNGKTLSSKKIEFTTSGGSTPNGPGSEPDPDTDQPTDPNEPEPHDPADPEDPETGDPSGPNEPDPNDPEPTDPEPNEPEPPTGEVPSGMVEIRVGDNIQSVLDKHPSGTTFYLRAGVHRLQTFKLSTGDTLVGEDGAVISGARLLTEFKPEGALWYAPNQKQEIEPVERRFYKNIDICIDTHTGIESPRCNYAEDLFFDDVMLKHVASKADVVPGTWYFDYANDRIYFADDPRGHRVETSVIGDGITPNGAENVTIRNVIFEKFAVHATYAALRTGDGWLVEDSVFRYNHGTGIRLGNRSTLRNSRSHHNGQLGVSAIGDRITIENSEIDHNNTAGYATGWEAGGTKFLRTSDMRVVGTHVHHNDGPGLWFDWDNRGSVSANNVVTDNSGPGFYAEASFDLVVRDSKFENNGFARTSWLLGAGILVDSSKGVLVTNNVVRNNYHGVTLIQAKTSHEIGNVEVRNNRIEMERGQTGMVVMGSLPNKGQYYENNITFTGNQYEFGSQDKPFRWEDGSVTFSKWKDLGMDSGSGNIIASNN